MRGEPASAHQCIRDCKCQAQSNYGQQHGHDCLTQPGAATLANRVGLTGEQRIISGVTRIVKGKRKKRRKKVVVPLRVRLAGSNKGSEPAYTLDANERGLFRIMWIYMRENSSEKHVGAQCLEVNKNIWGDQFPHEPDEYEQSDD